jgi:hypothetical protein
VTLRRAAVAGFALAALAVAGCGSSGGSPTRQPPQTQTAASPSGAAPQLRVVADDVSLAFVRQNIARLYREYPAVARYSTQDVAYTSRSRTRVLRACAARGAAATQRVETARVLACAPLVYFFYEYGRAKGVAQATGVADSIYSYASTEIQGPSDARTLLDGVLQGWGLPVASDSAASKPSTNPAASALIAAVRQAIGARHSVRVAITGYQGGPQPREQIVSDTSRDASTEVLHAGSASAEIRIVHGVAYVTGNRAGLRRLIGLPATTASMAHSRWLQAPTGSAAAKNLSAENSLSAVASSILPDRTDRVQLSSGPGGATTRVLRWSATAVNGASIHASLRVTAGTDPLPISATTSAGQNRQVVQFTDWDAPVLVTAPAGAVPLPNTGVG